MRFGLRSRGGDAMDVRFEDHAGFQRAASGLALAGGAVGLGCAAVARWWVFSPAGWLMLCAGAVLGALLGRRRIDAARENGRQAPSPWAVALAMMLAAAAVFA